MAPPAKASNSDKPAARGVSTATKYAYTLALSNVFAWMYETTPAQAHGDVFIPEFLASRYHRVPVDAKKFRGWLHEEPLKSPIKIEKLTVHDLLRYFTVVGQRGSRRKATFANIRSSLVFFYEQIGSSRPEGFDAAMREFFKSLDAAAVMAATPTARPTATPTATPTAAPLPPPAPIPSMPLPSTPAVPPAPAAQVTPSQAEEPTQAGPPSAVAASPAPAAESAPMPVPTPTPPPASGPAPASTPIASPTPSPSSTPTVAPKPTLSTSAPETAPASRPTASATVTATVTVTAKPRMANTVADIAAARALIEHQQATVPMDIDDEPPSFENYRVIAQRLLRSPSPADNALHALLVLYWNLPSQSIDAVAAIRHSQLAWSDDHLVISFTDSRSNRHTQLLHANLLAPEVCPILAIAIHLAVTKNAFHGRLFRAESDVQHLDYILRSSLSSTELAAFHRRVGEPNAAAHRSRRCLPSFASGDWEALIMVEGMFGRLADRMEQVCRFSLVALVVHADFLTRELPSGHLLFTTALFTTRRLDSLRARLIENPSKLDYERVSHHHDHRQVQSEHGNTHGHSQRDGAVSQLAAQLDNLAARVDELSRQVQTLPDIIAAQVVRAIREQLSQQHAVVSAEETTHAAVTAPAQTQSSASSQAPTVAPLLPNPVPSDRELHPHHAVPAVTAPSAPPFPQAPKRENVPRGPVAFRFPKGSVVALWQHWCAGDPPLRDLRDRDVPSYNTKRRLRDVRRLMEVIESAVGDERMPAALASRAGASAEFDAARNRLPPFVFQMLDPDDSRDDMYDYSWWLGVIRDLYTVTAFIGVYSLSPAIVFEKQSWTIALALFLKDSFMLQTHFGVLRLLVIHNYVVHSPVKSYPYDRAMDVRLQEHYVLIDSKTDFEALQQSLVWVKLVRHAPVEIDRCSPFELLKAWVYNRGSLKVETLDDWTINNVVPQGAFLSHYGIGLL
ncbi:hypothetical protein P43SY_002198 [Pythium insidiosum]|uniref:Core-binding (CB) domain-containing protein n=1 Tax=Pythium insidiosum TaxID=114742 RepID=A0AAD5QAM1_PYTIN|nr:hypothetical protein P43SY_002198 [Pythium insidiosum]